MGEEEIEAEEAMCTHSASCPRSGKLAIFQFWILICLSHLPEQQLVMLQPHFVTYSTLYLQNTVLLPILHSIYRTLYLLKNRIKKNQ